MNLSGGVQSAEETEEEDLIQQRKPRYDVERELKE